MFDCDDTLIDSSAAYQTAFRRGAAAFGYDFTPARYAKLKGTHPTHSADVISAATGVPADRILARITAELEQEVEARPPSPMPGAVALIESLHGRLPLAVATNGIGAAAIRMLERSGLLDAFETVCTADEAGEPKPSPAVYQLAASRLGASPATTIGVEDSPVGARAVKNAGMRLIWVTSIPADSNASPVLLDDADLRTQSLEDSAVVPFILGTDVPSKTTSGFFA